MAASNIDVSSATPDLSELIDRATTRKEILTLTGEGDRQAVLLSLEAFDYLVNSQQYKQRELMPPNEFQRQFRQALVEAGYDSREKIIDLVRDVKREIYEERRQQR